MRDTDPDWQALENAGSPLKWAEAAIELTEEKLTEARDNVERLDGELVGYVRMRHFLRQIEEASADAAAEVAAETDEVQQEASCVLTVSALREICEAIRNALAGKVDAGALTDAFHMIQSAIIAQKPIPEPCGPNGARDAEQPELRPDTVTCARRDLVALFSLVRKLQRTEETGRFFSLNELDGLENRLAWVLRHGGSQ